MANSLDRFCCGLIVWCILGAARWDDLVNIVPATIQLLPERLVGMARRTKTTGAGRKFFTRKFSICRYTPDGDDWGAEWFALLRGLPLPERRDWLVPAICPDRTKVSVSGCPYSVGLPCFRNVLVALGVPLSRAALLTWHSGRAALDDWAWQRNVPAETRRFLGAWQDEQGPTT